MSLMHNSFLLFLQKGKRRSSTTLGRDTSHNIPAMHRYFVTQQIQKIYIHTPSPQHLSSRAINRSGQRTALNVNTAKVPVFRTSAIVSCARETEDAQMPISRVRRGAGGEWAGGLGEGLGAGRVPEGDGVGREILPSMLAMRFQGRGGGVQSHKQHCAKHRPRAGPSTCSDRPPSTAGWCC